MKPGNSTTIFLMVSSMVLLVVLQMFWLRSSYERAYFDLRNRVDGLFQQAMTAVMDSSFLKRIERVPGDSVRKTDNYYFTQHIDSSRLPAPHGKRRVDVAASSQVQIFISSKNPQDSFKTILRPLASRFREGSLHGSSFVIRLNGDSLNLDSIKAQFRRNLRKANLDLSFSVMQSKRNPPFSLPTPKEGFSPFVADMNDGPSGKTMPPVFGNVMLSDWVRIPPFSNYRAQIVNIRPAMLREIAPQIFFSGVLTLLTLLSFIFMFRSIRSQQRLMILKNDFISNITHELKTPIATVSVALEALKSFRGIDNPRVTEEYLDIARQELSRLSMLTEKVLTTSLFDEHGIKIDFEPVDLEQTIAEVLHSLQLVFEKRGATVAFEKKGDNFVLQGSHIHLTNVVHNLLDNALKYSLANPEITVMLNDVGTTIQLVVMDKGLGIPREFHQKIFEKFFRMPTGDVHNIKGYGLGLSYVDSVVKSHHGSIALMSQPGSGSTFTLSLPKTPGSEGKMKA